MAEYASGSITIPGLSGSDVNFTSMIDDLYKIELKYGERLIKWRDDWALRLEAFQRVRSELKNLQTALSAMNTVDKFLVKNATSSKSEVATVTPGAEAIQGSYNLEVGQMARSATWSLNTSFANKDTVVNNTGTTQHFTYTYKGKTRTVNIPSGTTLEGMKNIINNDSQNLGVKAQLLSGSTGMVFQFRGMDTGSSANLTVDSCTVQGMEVNSVSKWANQNLNYSPLSRVYASPTSVINSTNQPQEFTLKLAGLSGGEANIQLAPGGTLQDLADGLNTALGGQGTATVKEVVPGDPSKGYTLEIIPDVADPDMAFYMDQQLNTNISLVGFSSPEAVINTESTAKDFRFFVGGKETVIQVPPGMTLNQLVSAVNATTGTSKARASLTTVENPQDPGGDPLYVLCMESTDPSKTISAGNSSLEYFNTDPLASNWVAQKSQNATVRIDGWPADPAWHEVSSNTVTELVPGLTINLRSAGDTTITVDLDTAAITKNVEAFVDAMNSFRSTIMELTAVDTKKSLTDSKVATSQFEMELGSVLTGNYGIQMMSSRIKSIVASQGVGFVHAQKMGDFITGDVFSALSQIGIFTNTDQGSDKYGLLEINTIDNHKGQLSLEQALAKDPVAIARLFASKSEGVSTSPYFDHSSHIVGITQPGTYDVTYEVDGSGNIIGGTINGKRAEYDAELRQLAIYSHYGDPNVADGLVLEINDFTPNGKFAGQVSIRNGKVNELLDIMEGSEGLLGDKGSLKILEDNYQKIMDNIDEKISKEDDRLVKWRRNMQLRFARLEEVLRKYNSINEDLKTQIKQLSSGSSS